MSLFQNSDDSTTTSGTLLTMMTTGLRCIVVTLITPLLLHSRNQLCAHDARTCMCGSIDLFRNVWYFCNLLFSWTSYTIQRRICSMQRLESERAAHNQKSKTYIQQDSLVVTDPTTNCSIWSLSMAERTGCRVFFSLWPYVKEMPLSSIMLRKWWNYCKINGDR